MRRRLLICVLLLVLLPAGCGNPPAEGTQLYFLSVQDHGPAIAGVPYAGKDPTAEELIAALLSGPEDDRFRSPFPAGVYLRGTELQDGLLTVDFSEQYGGLTDISLTLADYCVVLTVCQLEGVDAVEITVSGRQLDYRSHQILTPSDAVWEDTGG